MDVREKLRDLLDRFVYDDWYSNNDIAEKLVSNGVRVQEWISVDDRLPEPKEETICIDADGDMMIGTYTEWGWMFPCYFKSPTHWMPLPEPPKENDCEKV